MRNKVGVAVLLLVLSAAGAHAQESGENVRKTGSFRQDLYLAGGEVILDARLVGDATLAGGDVRIAGAVTGDVLAAGGKLLLQAPVSDDVRAAGGNVSIAAPIAGDLIAMAGELQVSAPVGERAFLAGGKVHVEGRVGGHLRAAGALVEINAEVAGPVSVYAENLRLGPQARIIGPLYYEGPAEPAIAEGARIEGGIQVQKTERPGRVGVFLAMLAVIGGFLLIGLVYAVLFPHFSQAAAEQIRRDPWPSLGWGFLTLLLLPAAAVFLMITVLGIPFGLLILWLYPVVLLLGYFTALVFLARRLAVWAKVPRLSRGALVLWLLAAMVAWAVVQMIPVIGWLGGFFLWVFGIGGFVQTLLHTGRGADSSGYGSDI